jgi:hypothetical protein
MVEVLKTVLPVCYEKENSRILILRSLEKRAKLLNKGSFNVCVPDQIGESGERMLFLLMGNRKHNPK